MSRLRSTALWVLALVLLVLGPSGCQRDLVPPLVEVKDVSPRELELGDRVELRGLGFPQGRSARVTFRGELRRAGERARSGVVIEARGAVTASERIEVAFDEALEERFCGRGDAASHATFAGEVEVAFASSQPGAPPLAGVMHGLQLDVRPSSVRSVVAEARIAEGTRLLSFLGVVAGPASGRGLPVESVAAGSPAARAGLQVGDVLSALDGVHVSHVSDLLPASARTIELGFRRGEGGVEETRTIPLVGYAGARIPTEYASALLLVGVALAVLLLLVVPGPAALGALELRLASRLRTATLAAALRAVFGEGPRVVAAAFGSVLVGTFALGPHVIDADVDGALLLVAALAMMAASRVAAARGLRASARAAGSIALSGAVLALALAGMVALEGALQLGELVRRQGGAPWELAATRWPAAAVLALPYLGALLALARPIAPPTAEEPRARHATASVEILDRLGVLLACALAVAVFFGGWQLPGVPAARALPLQILGAVVFVAKTWALVAALRAAVALAPPWFDTTARRFVGRRLVPVLAVGLALALLSRRVAPGSAFEAAFGATSAAAALLVVVRSAVRVREAMGRPEPQASPFL